MPREQTLRDSELWPPWSQDHELPDENMEKDAIVTMDVERVEIFPFLDEVCLDSGHGRTRSSTGIASPH